MTADHPTREERYAALSEAAAAHEAVMDSLVPMPNRQERESGRALVKAVRAAALAAADPAPAQPECDGSGSCPAPLHIHGCFADTDDARCDDPGDHAPAALSDDLLQQHMAVGWYCDHEFSGATCAACFRNIAHAASVAARAARPALARCPGCGSSARTWPRMECEAPAPAPEVSRGVAEVCPVKRDEFSAERRAQIIEALSWWEDDSGRWGHEKAANTLHAHEVEWCGRTDGQDAFDAHPADDGADCCQERTTAGGCGCGRSGEGETA